VDIKKSLKDWLAGRRQKEEGAAEPVAAPSAAAEAAPAEELDPAVVAAIAAVIAVEVKMFQSLQGARFTFGAGAAPQGWSETGRLLVRPYQGVR